MRSPRVGLHQMVASIAAAALLVVGLAVASPIAPAAADTAPTDPATPATVAADSLPTVQINGVAWSQVIVGGTVYVAGDFATARPAGAAAGVGTVTRSNLLAYDLDSGVLIDTWAPVLNGPAYVIKASLDGTRLYVGGDFTYVNGSPQNRMVVLDRATGLRVPGFTVGANAAVRAIASTPSTIYFGGNFNTVTGATRNRLAAISSTTGALLSWAVSAQSAQVDALVVTPDNSKLIVGGRFTMLGGIPALGSGAVSTSTAAVLPWAANQVIKNWGFGAGIQSLETDGTLIYGSGFAFIKDASSAGNLEGVFAADPSSGAIRWIEDCHGDTYSVFANPGGSSVYAAGHIHNCQNIGAYPESGWKHGLAFSKTASMTITPNASGGNYYDWQGYQAPALLDFFPDFTTGTYTGQGQATWQVTGNADYVLYGGEFPTVNGQGQQGLARMAVSSKSTNARPLKLSGAALTPAATSRAAGTAQVSWPTNWDQDNEALTYEVLRDSLTTPVHTTTAKSLSWQLPRLSFTDTGLANGSAHTYRVRATDPFGNTTTSPSVSVTVAAASAGNLSTYAAEVLGDSPAGYWRLGETSGAAVDWTGYGNGTAGTAVTRAVPGALSGDADRAARFAGSVASRVIGTRSAAGSNRFSVEAWFKTTSTTGGKIVGYGNSSTSANSTSDDRHVYMGPDGKLTFGVYPGTVRAVTTPASYNDGQWHHLVASLGTDGMKLYVDGAVRASDPNTISAQVYSGYWRIGGDAVGATWPGSGGDNFTGDIDDVAVYGRALSANQVAIHYGTGQTGAIPNLPPTASFTAAPGVLVASFDGSGSSDFEGPIANYAWDFGDGATGTGPTATHPYAVGGVYTVTLTVTDSGGTTNSTSQQVVVRAPNVLPVASFTASNTDLTASLDATGSTDSDGTIPSYAWTFGDGTSGTGATTTHLYAAAGTYSVTLTVTDNDGGTNSANRSVTVTAPTSGIVASDAFGRTVANGFGSADLGGAWTATSGATSVSAGKGVLTLTGANSNAGARLPALTGTQLSTRVTETWSKRPNGSGGWLLVRGRITTGGEYRLKVAHTSAGAVAARIVRTNAAGTETAITTDLTIPGLTYTTGTALTALFEVTGTSPTTLRAKVWPTTGIEPAGWLIETTDSTAGLQAAGHTGLAALLSSSTTNGPVVVQVDDYSVSGPFDTTATNQAPVASFTATPTGLSAAVDASASSDADGTISSYAWAFGDGTTGTGVAATHTYSTAGTYTITLTVTDNTGATGTTTRSVTVAAANQLPMASFTATPTGLSAAVDASASSDPDGTIASYAWTFGDGTTGTGATATHAYAAAGTYTINLTVTDNRGAVATTTRSVTVAAGNQPPVASFTATPAGLSVAVDASGSSDPNGTIVSYAWAFGDGGTATGVSATRTYAAAGTYAVTLVVTDNAGVTATATQDVTVGAAATPLASDAFERTVTSGWGSADLGGAWTSTAGATSVAGGKGVLSLAGANTNAGARLPGISGNNLSTRVTMSWNKRPAGSGGWFLVRGRIATGGEYRLKLGYKANGTVTAWVVRTNTAGTETAVTTETTVPGLTYAAGTVLVARFDVTGGSPTALRAKVWAAASAEPAAWTIDATDSTAGLQAPGHTGVAALTSTTTTNGPIAVSVDDFTVTAP